MPFILWLHNLFRKHEYTTLAKQSPLHLAKTNNLPLGAFDCYDAAVRNSRTRRHSSRKDLHLSGFTSWSLLCMLFNLRHLWFHTLARASLVASASAAITRCNWTGSRTSFLWRKPDKQRVKYMMVTPGLVLWCVHLAFNALCVKYMDFFLPSQWIGSSLGDKINASDDY